MDTFAEIADERRALADDLAKLTADQQNAASLCHRWRVHDVAAHLIMPMEVGLPKFVLAMVRAGGNFDKANDRITKQIAKRPFAEIVDVLRAKADSRFTPPGEGPEIPLVDVIVHGLDIRWPLSINHATPPDRVCKVLAAVMDPPAPVVAKSQIDGLRFEATDIDFTRGDGAQVRGPANALLLGCLGRTVAFDSLTGDGVDVLRSRV